MREVWYYERLGDIDSRGSPKRGGSEIWRTFAKEQGRLRPFAPIHRQRRNPWGHNRGTSEDCSPPISSYSTLTRYLRQMGLREQGYHRTQEIFLDSRSI